MKYIESDVVELKSRVTPDICKEVVAFANTRGGTLYIGIEDDGSVSGVDNPDDTVLQLNNMIRDTIKPDVTMFTRYEIKSVEEKEVISVTVQKGPDRPYYLGSKGLKPNGVFVRNGSSTDPASDAAIRRMIKETDGDNYEDARSLEQDLSFDAAAEQFAKRGIEFGPAKMQTLNMRSQDGIYSNVALLVSDQCAHTIKAATFNGTDKSQFRDRREFTGSLFRQMEELYQYLDLRNQTKATFEGLYRNDVRDYPEEALREALMNCLVHRNYSFSDSTLVSIYDDRMEFVSIGGLAKGIDLEDITAGVSICRNPKLAAIFYRLELIESYGSGMPKIMKAYEGTGLAPTIAVTSNVFKIILPNRNVKQTPGAKRPKSEEEQILLLIEKNGFAVRSDVEALLDVSQATANRLLKRMLAYGLICQEGAGRRTRYRKV